MQTGASCSDPSTTIYRLHLDSGRFEALPPLPQPRQAHTCLDVVCHAGWETSMLPRVLQIGLRPIDKLSPRRRYSPSAVLLDDGRLHVFGGLLPDLATPARDHWSLAIDAGGQQSPVLGCNVCAQQPCFSSITMPRMPIVTQPLF